MCDFISVFVVLRLVLVYLKSKIGFLVPKHIHARAHPDTKKHVRFTDNYIQTDIGEEKIEKSMG